MKKSLEYLILLGAVVIFILVGSFVIDLGINSKFFVKRDFNRAFIYRTTGDCVAFVNYVSREKEEWRKRCEEEKSRSSEPIRKFEVQNVSHSFGSDRAFLQAELTRNTSLEKDYSYSASYELKKIGLVWKIDQELK